MRSVVRVVLLFGLVAGLIAAEAPAPDTPVTPGLSRPCQDVFLLFARGSGQPPEKVDGDGSPREYLSLEAEVEDALAETGLTFDALDLANDPEVGTELGYPALGEFVDFVEGEASWTGAITGGAYNQSQQSGVDEMRSWLSARMDRCPHEVIIASGYSQGAHVMGDTFFALTSGEREQLGYGLLFGDPKLDNGKHGAFWNWHDAPWHRGSFSTKRFAPDGGSLEPRHPYRPEELAGRFTSWCDENDGVCVDDPKLLAAWFAGIYNDHSEYMHDEMPKAVNELLPVIMDRVDRPDGEGFSFNLLPIRPGSPLTLDLMMVIDTTGSMGPHIGSAKAQATELGEAMLTLLPDTRLSVVEYRDHGDAVPARVVVPFTDDENVFAAGVDQLRASGGGDYPEAMLNALMTGFDQDWRAGALKIAIVVTDAPMKDPEPVTGYTSAGVLRTAYELDPVNIYPVLASSNSQLRADAQLLADGSDGEVIELGGRNLADTLTELVDDLRLEPIAMLTGTEVVRPGDTVVLDSGSSYDPDGAIVGWEWDLDGDGVFEETSLDRPSITTSFDTEGEHLVGVRVLAWDGGSATATTVVTVDADHVIPTVGAPTDVSLTRVDESTLRTTWTAPATSDVPVDHYVVRRAGDGELLTVLPADAETVVTISDAPSDGDLAITVESAAGPHRSERVRAALEGDVVFGDWKDTHVAPPGLDRARAGRTIPIRFEVVDREGAPWDGDVPVEVVTVAEATCDGQKLGGATAAETAGRTELRRTGDTWHFNWKTEQAWAGTCRVLGVDLSDGMPPHELWFDLL